MIRWICLFIFFALLFACDTASNIQPPNKSYFIKYFGGDGDQTARGLIVYKDSVFFILGNSLQPEGTTKRVYLAKADKFGKLLSQITYGIDMDAIDIELTSDGKIAVVANKNVSSSNVDILLTRFDLNLVPLDNVLLFAGTTNSLSENAKALTELSDGGFIVEGFVGDINTSSIELHLRVDNQLKKYVGPWNETHGAGSRSVGIKTVQNPAVGKFYTFGYTNATYDSSGKDNVKYGAYTLGDDGLAGGGVSDEPFFEQSGVGLDNYLTDVVTVPSGGYLMVGVSSGTTEDNLKAVITSSNNPGLVFDYSGVSHDLILKDNNSQSFLGKGPNPVEAFATVYSSISNYNLILANTYNTPTGKSDILLTKVDNNLVSMWGGASEPNYVSFGGDGDDQAAAVAELPDGHIMVLGTMQLGNPLAQKKIALIKLNSAGKLAD